MLGQINIGYDLLSLVRTY